MTIYDQVCFSFACQVLEYHPQPWNQWVQVGDLVQARSYHATLSIGAEQLACLSGESFNMEMIMIESRRLIDKQRSFHIDNDIIIRISFTGRHQGFPPIMIGFHSLALVSDFIHSSNHNN